MKTAKIFKIVFTLILAFQIGSGLIMLASPKIAWAAAASVPLDYTPQVQIPITGSGLDQNTIPVGKYDPSTGIMSSDLLAKYIKALYDYGMGIAGILAAIVLMGGGILWLTSAGNDSRVTQAKELIAGSLTGLVILFCSWIILNTINPDLLKLKVIQTELIKVAYVNSSGFIENTSDIPSDMVYGWQCLNSTNQTCANTDPPTINLNINLCYSGKPTNTKPTGCYYVWCCGKSASDVKRSNICQGKADGESCRVNSTAVMGSGYCLNHKCEPCKVSGKDSDHEGASCSVNYYECQSDALLCGKNNHGYCFCNVFGNNCTCRFKQPLL